MSYHGIAIVASETIADHWKPSFDHCERHKYALFPMHADTKQSAGPWRYTGTSTDPAQWLVWVKAGYMLGVSACASKIILIDVDVGKVGREAAYDYFKKWCKSLGFEPPKPYAQSRSGGWHFAFRCPEGFEPEMHRGTISIKISKFRALAVGEEDGEVISVRNRGICVAPGSVYHGQPYVLYPDPPVPDPLPPGLHELLKLPVVEAQANGHSGLSEPTDVAQLYAELDDLGEFDAEPDWFKHMGAIKLALGDTEDGKEVAWQMTNPGKRCERFDSVWARAKTVDPGGSSVCRIGTAIMRYEQITGKKFRVRERRRTVEEQFGAVVPAVPEGIAPLVPAAQGDPLPEHPNLTAQQAVGLEDFVAYLPGGTFCYLPTREHWPATGVNSKLGDVMVNGVTKIRSSTWLAQNRSADAMAWCPGEPMLVKDRLLVEGGWIQKLGDTTLNNYRPAKIEPRQGDASPWLGHIMTIYPDDWQHIVNWLAHRVQRPGEKINHTLVLGGKPGVGKDTLLEPIKPAVGAWNFYDVSPANIMGRFNSHLKSIVLRISEVHDLGDIDRFAFYDKTKTLCAAPPDTHRIDEKNLREYQAVNVCGVIMTTNHKAGGLYLPPDDRRHYVAWSPTPEGFFKLEYFDALYRWLATGGNEIVAHYLATLDISAFKPKATPPKTPAFWEIVQSARSPESADVEDALDALGTTKDEKGNVVRPDAVTLAKIEFSPGATPEFKAWLRDRKNGTRISHRMADAGYEPVRNPNADDGLWRIGDKRRAIYARRTLSTDERLAHAAATVKEGARAKTPPPPPPPSNWQSGAAPPPPPPPPVGE